MRQKLYNHNQQIQYLSLLQKIFEQIFIIIFKVSKCFYNIGCLHWTNMAAKAPLIIRLVSASVAVSNRASQIIRDVLLKGELGIVEKVVLFSMFIYSTSYIQWYNYLTITLYKIIMALFIFYVWTCFNIKSFVYKILKFH